MPTLEITGSSNDGYVYGYHASTYLTARSTAFVHDTTKNYGYVGQEINSGYYIYRTFLKFDTSSIPDKATVIQANLKLYPIVDTSLTDFDIQIVKQGWSSQDPLSDSNRDAAFDGCLAGTVDSGKWLNTVNMVLNQYNVSENLDPTWINKTGNTYYSLRSSRDYAGTTPTDDEFVTIRYANTPDASQRPILVVRYSMPEESSFFQFFPN